MYMEYAEEKKAYSIDLKAVLSLLGLNKGLEDKGKLPLERKVKPTKNTCQVEVEDKVNNWDNIETALKELKEQNPNKKEFNMNDIIKQIHKSKPSENYKLKV